MLKFFLLSVVLPRTITILHNSYKKCQKTNNYIEPNRVYAIFMAKKKKKMCFRFSDRP